MNTHLNTFLNNAIDKEEMESPLYMRRLDPLGLTCINFKWSSTEWKVPALPVLGISLNSPDYPKLFLNYEQRHLFFSQFYLLPQT